MTKKRNTKTIIAIIACIAMCAGIVMYCNYAKAKQASVDAMLAERDEIASKIGTSSETVTVEYGADGVDLWSAVLAAKQEHPEFSIDYTVDDETELATFSTMEVGEHVIVYQFSASDSYGQSVKGEKTVVYVVQDTQAPVITLSDTEATVYEGENYDVSSLVESVADLVDGELAEASLESQASDETMGTSLRASNAGYYTIATDYSKDSSVGEYEVKVRAVDCNGLESEATATIKVVAKPQTKVVDASAAAPASAQSYYDPSRIYVGNYTAVVYFTAEDQAQTDAPDSAICYEQHGRTVVADHAYQGFNAIISNTSGVLLGSKIHRVSLHYGTINDDRTDIYYDDGGTFLGNNDAQIVMFTCAGGTGRYAVTYWDYD